MQLLREFYGYAIFLFICLPAICAVEFAMFVGGRSFKSEIRSLFAVYHLKRLPPKHIREITDQLTRLRKKKK